MKKLGLGIALTLSSIALPAYADDAEPAPAVQEAPNFRGASTLPDVIITGRPSVPLAAMSILRLEPALTLTELRISLLEKVEKAIFGDAF
ncbi:MAG: hypothetical protein HOV80_25210 [Polyangiaceae bacterium]|nr:hypothetical protein [Polyangiaceae bacterium]